MRQTYLTNFSPKAERKCGGNAAIVVMSGKLKLELEPMATAVQNVQSKAKSNSFYQNPKTNHLSPIDFTEFV